MSDDLLRVSATAESDEYTVIFRGSSDQMNTLLDAMATSANRLLRRYAALLDEALTSENHSL